MNTSCVLPLVILVLCESVLETRQAPASVHHVGKFRRDIVRRIELPSTAKIGAPLKRSGDVLRPSEIKLLGFGKMEKPCVPVNPSPEPFHRGFGKLARDCIDMMARRSLSDRPPSVSSGFSFQADPSCDRALKDKFKFADIDFKNRVLDNAARFNEPSINFSDGPFRQPESSKVNSQIKDLISQSLFSRPITSGSATALKSNSLSDTGINDGHAPSKSISLKISLNGNLSDILSLSKPDLPTKTSSLTITRNKNGDVKPFRLLTQGDKFGVNIDQMQMDNVAKKSHEKILENQKDIDVNDLLKYKNADARPAAEEDTMKSARRLFDVIQSQSPLDLLNIPLLMNSFKIGPSSLSTKVSGAKFGCSPLKPRVNQNQAIWIESPVSTTQKCSVPQQDSRDENEKLVVSPVESKVLETTVSKPISLLLSRNHSWNGNYFPWGGPLSSILTQNLPNMPLILIPLNKIRLGSIITVPEKDSFELRGKNTDVNKTSLPQPDDTGKVFGYQDMFSKQFTNFNLKDLIDFSSTVQKPERKTGESLDLLSIPFFKIPDEMDFQKRVGDFLKLSKLNASDFHRKLDETEKSEPSPDEEALKTSGLTRTSNSSHLSQEAKSSMFHDRGSILPLLKITANMALSKYSNIPRVDKKLLDDAVGPKGNLSFNQPDAARVLVSWTLAPTPTINIENANATRGGSYVTEIDSAISTEASVDKSLNELSDRPVLGNSSTGIESTDLPSILRAGAEKNASSEDILPHPEPLSSVMKTVANNFIQQSIKEFEKTMKLDPKILDHETLPRTNSSNETNRSDDGTLESDAAHAQGSSLPATATSSAVAQVAVKTNRSSDNENPTSSDSKTDIGSKTDNLHPNSSDNISHKKLSEEEETSSVVENVSGVEPDLTSTTENVNVESNSHESFSQDVGNSARDVNLENPLLSEENIKSNWARVKEMLSATLNNETKDDVKYTQNFVLQKYAELSPPEISELNINPSSVRLGNSPSTAPIVAVSNVPKKKNGLQQSPLFGNASYYLGNKSRKELENPRNRQTNSEEFQIPAVLIEILNRMDSTVNGRGGTGYNMAFAPVQKNHSWLNLQPTEDTNSHFQVKPERVYSNSLPDIPVKGSLTPISPTTEFPAYTKTDNIYQVVTMKNESETVGVDKTRYNSPTPKIDDCILFHSDVSGSGEPNDGRSVHRPFSPSLNNRPIILVAIDPLKAWDSKGAPDHRSLGFMPLGIIIKSTSVLGRPDLKDPDLRAGTSLIGEAQQTWEGLKCTTTCPVAPGKCKEVTIFPIYPMYPVYPLKPIISSNSTALTTKTI